jgi:PTH1 family peptidyl-tRNA hydrolase
MIIFGLGNPGREYRLTRHNAGYMFVNAMAKLYNKRFYTRKGFRITKLSINKKVIKLIKPICWMNQSGIAISSILQEFNEDFMIVIDDVNIPLGKIRLKGKGSDGGHLGLRSVAKSLGSSNFPRLRIGIGRANEDIVNYVLSTFRRDEKRILKMVMCEGIKGIKIVMKNDFNKAQNYINSIDLTIKLEARNPKS